MRVLILYFNRFLASSPDDFANFADLVNEDPHSYISRLPVSRMSHVQYGIWNGQLLIPLPLERVTGSSDLYRAYLACTRPKGGQPNAIYIYVKLRNVLGVMICERVRLGQWLVGEESQLDLRKISWRTLTILKPTPPVVGIKPPRAPIRIREVRIQIRDSGSSSTQRSLRVYDGRYEGKVTVSQSIYQFRLLVGFVYQFRLDAEDDYSVFDFGSNSYRSGQRLYHYFTYLVLGFYQNNMWFDILVLHPEASQPAPTRKQVHQYYNNLQGRPGRARKKYAVEKKQWPLEDRSGWLPPSPPLLNPDEPNYVMSHEQHSDRDLESWREGRMSYYRSPIMSVYLSGDDDEREIFQGIPTRRLTVEFSDDRGA